MTEIKKTPPINTLLCYLEYPIYTKSRWHADAGIGGAFALNKAGSKTNFYGNTNGIVHVLLKVTFDWTLAKHTMPIHACMVWNPQADRAFFSTWYPII